MQSSFAPSCPLPPTGTRFVSGPNVRGTLDIVWACLSILLLCTWSIQHLNIPPPVTPRTLGETVRHHVLRTQKKVKWMILTLLAPEILLGSAWSQYWAARYGRRNMKELAEEDGVEWTIEHSFFADMGGMIIEFPEDLRNEFAILLGQPPINPADENLPSTISSEASSTRAAPNHTAGEAEGLLMASIPDEAYVAERFVISIPTENNQKSQELRDLISHPSTGIKAQRHHWTSNTAGETRWKPHQHNGQIVDSLLHVHSLRGDAISVESYQRLMPLSGNIWVLNTDQLYLARDFGIIKSLPNIPSAQLKDKSKSDVVAKVITLLQVLWLILQLIVRRFRHLPSTQLEIMTLAYAGSSFITYIAFWYKPKDVAVPFYFTAQRIAQRHELHDISCEGPHRPSWMDSSYWFSNIFCHDASGSLYEMQWLVFGTAGGAVLFGAPHFLSWDQQFPSPAERLLWRVASSLTTGVPFLTVAMGYIIQTALNKLAWFKKWHRGSRGSMILVPFLLLYFLARGYILVEVFRTMAFLPSGAFTSTFASDFPHLG